LGDEDRLTYPVTNVTGGGEKAEKGHDLLDLKFVARYLPNGGEMLLQTSSKD
jgi:hypothetical protein